MPVFVTITTSSEASLLGILNPLLSVELVELNRVVVYLLSTQPYFDAILWISTNACSLVAFAVGATLLSPTPDKISFELANATASYAQLAIALSSE